MTSRHSERATLQSLKIVEIAQGWAGPTVGALLADFGAEVIKVESIQRPDWWRGAPLAGDDGFTYERSALFNGINRNKLGITLDLSRERGRELLLELVRDADVFIENFTSHVIHQLRLTHDDLVQVNASIISISMPAYGSTGAWRDFPALGTTVESMCGVQSVTGYEDGPPRIQSMSWDPVIGMYACFAVAAALHRRRMTGKGQHIELSHIEAGTHPVAGPLLAYLLTGRMPERMGNSSSVYAPHGCYPAAGTDQWITIVVRNDREWKALVAVLDREGRLRDPRFDTLLGRLKHRHELDVVLGDLTRDWIKHELFEVLQRVGVPAGPVATPEDLVADRHLAARGFFRSIERAFVGTHLYPSRFFSMDRTEPTLRRPAPTLGQDNAAILSGRLGLSAGELADLERKGIIGNRPG